MFTLNNVNIALDLYSKDILHISFLSLSIKPAYSLNWKIYVKLFLFKKIKNVELFFHSELHKLKYIKSSKTGLNKTLQKIDLNGIFRL